MKNLLVAIFCFSVLISKGKKNEPFFPASLIKPELKENANAVIRSQKLVLEVYSIDKAVFSVQEIITVLNSNGDNEASLYLPYNTYRKPTITTANFYNKEGELIEKVKNKDIYDQTLFDGFSLYTDARFKKITPHIKIYPYTVEYEYSMEFDGIIEYPDWQSTDSYNVAVEHSGFTIHIPENMDLKYIENKINPKINGNNTDGIKTYQWEINDFEAIEYEPFSISFDQLVPHVKVSPTEFSYCGYKGKLDSWQNFGHWVNQLLDSREELTPERITYLNELVKNEADTKGKIEKIYHYLQQKTRYVSVQLGIGGYQPISALKVDEVGYGDCKALTNYMKSMLSAVGISSYYTLIRAGKDAAKIDPGFPSQVFNHAILTVPLKADTLFLECTNQFSPCGFLGDFTSGRYALLISDNGGKLIYTNNYDDKVNTWNLNASVHIEESGNAQVEESVVYSGVQYNYIEDELRKTKEKQIESEYKNSKISGIKFKDISYIEKRRSIPSITRQRSFDIKKYASVMSSRMFLPVNALNKRTVIPPNLNERKQPFELKYAYLDRDTIVFDIPSGFDTEFLSEPVLVESDFGRYEAKIKVEGTKIVYYRYDLNKAGIFPPEKYKDYIGYRQKIVKADNQKLVLKKIN